MISAYFPSQTQRMSLSLSLSPGIRSGLPSICYPVRWHRSLLVSGWQWGLLFIRPCSGHCNQWGLSVLGWTTCLPVLPYRWIKMECFRSTELYWPSMKCNVALFFFSCRILWFAVFFKCIRVSLPTDCRRGPVAQHNSGLDRYCDIVCT